MKPERFDLLARSLEQMSTRRTALRIAAGMAGGVAGGAIALRYGRAADDVPPPPPASFSLKWPVCSAERPHYCVAEFSVDGQDQLAGDPPAYIADVLGISDPEASGLATNVNWQVNRYNDDPLCDTHTLAGCGWNLEDADLDKEIFLRIRMGRLKPYLTYQESGVTRVRVTGSEAAGWETEIRGRPGILAWPDNPPADQEQAAHALPAFHGMGYPREEWPADIQPFEGMVSSTAHGWAYPEWVDGGWEVRLSSPHFLPDSSVNHGSYAAWMAPANLQRMGLTTQQAVGGELKISRSDDGVVSAIDVSITEFNDGVFIEIPDLTFSSPAIIMRKRGGGTDPGQGDGGSAHDCPKGKVYKHGRCVKKKKKHRKKKH